MLASICPLGERARGNRWGLTAAAYSLASMVTAAAIGATLGLAHPLPKVVFAAAAIGAAILDLTRVPTTRRQVDETWAMRYRGWVYGAGWGAQLGAGVVTVVSTATVYAWLVGAASTDAWVGGLAGAAFGSARSLSLLTVRRATTPSQLRIAVHRLARRAKPVRMTTAAASALIGVSALLA